MFKMPVSFVSVSRVIPGNTRQVCKSPRGRRKGKKTFYRSPQVVVHPTFSHREVVHLKERPWQYSGCSFTATSLQSQLCSGKGLPLLPLPFFPCHCFCKAGCQPERLPDPSCHAAATTRHAREGKGQNCPFYQQSRFFLDYSAFLPTVSVQAKTTESVL